jgi:N-methylhydantoinase B/oxoprolinase/acetone carboxylase alpha subunit
MDNIKHPPEPYAFKEGQLTAFLSFIREGHKDEIAALKAKIPQSAILDAKAEIGAEIYAEARLASSLPLAEVKERVNDLMREARSGEMSLRDALDILERQDKAWSKNAKVDMTSDGKALRFEMTPEVAAVAAEMDEIIKRQMMDE